jgi:tetratricopeptide (TPR) repeat protein
VNLLHLTTARSIHLSRIPRNWISCTNVFILSAMINLELTASVLAAAVPQESGSSVESSLEYTAAVEQHRSTIDELQSDLGPFDTLLIQPISDLTDLLIEAGDFSEAIDLLEQQLQIYRISYGLYSSEQIALLEKLMNLYVLRQEWDEVSNRLSYLSWMYSRDERSPVPDQLAGLKRLRDWHMFVLNNDRREREPIHLLSIRDISEKSLNLAVDYYGKDNPELIDYIYDRAQADLYIALAIMLTSETSPALITMTEGVASTVTTRLNRLRTASDFETAYGSRVNTVIDRAFRNNMSRHFAHISAIRDYYADTGNQEAEAMALIYMGDSMLLRDQYESNPLEFSGQARGSSNIGSANRYYSQATSLLLGIGIPAVDTDLFFSCPVLLPVNSFTPAFSATQLDCRELSETDALDLGDIHLLVDTVPGIRQLSTAVTTGSEVGINSTVQFAVPGNGQPSRIEVLASDPDTVRNRVQARTIVDRLQFRPAIIEGRPVLSEKVTMRLFLPE